MQEDRVGKSDSESCVGNKLARLVSQGKAVLKVMQTIVVMDIILGNYLLLLMSCRVKKQQLFHCVKRD